MCQGQAVGIQDGVTLLDPRRFSVRRSSGVRPASNQGLRRVASVASKTSALTGPWDAKAVSQFGAVHAGAGLLRSSRAASADRGFTPDTTCGSGLGWIQGKLTPGGRGQVLHETIHGVRRGRLTTEIRKDAWIAKSTDPVLDAWRHRLEARLENS